MTTERVERGQCGACGGLFRVRWDPEPGRRIVEVDCPDCEAECVFERDDLFVGGMGSTPVMDNVSPFERAGVAPTGGSGIDRPREGS